MHAKEKVIPRGGDDVWESDALLHRVAELTIGMAGADLANLLNEAAILMVSCNATHWMPSALLPASWKSLGTLYGQAFNYRTGLALAKLRKFCICLVPARMKTLLGGIDITVASSRGMAIVLSSSFRLICGHSIRVRQSHATLAMGEWNSFLLSIAAGWVQVRQDKAEIDLALIQEAMDKRRLGLPNARLPPSEAKTHMATVQVRPTSPSLACCVPRFLKETVKGQVFAGEVMSSGCVAERLRPVQASASHTALIRQLPCMLCAADKSCFARLYMQRDSKCSGGPAGCTRSGRLPDARAAATDACVHPAARPTHVAHDLPAPGAAPLAAQQSVNYPVSTARELNYAPAMPGPCFEAHGLR